MGRKRGSKNAPAGKPVADKQPDATAVSGAADKGGTAGVDSVGVDATAAGEAGQAAVAAGTAAQGLDAGTDAANKDPAAADGAAGAPATQAEGVTDGQDGDAAVTGLAGTIPVEPWSLVDKAGDVAGDSAANAVWGVCGKDNREAVDDFVTTLRQRWRVAAAFVVANREAPISSIPIHLALQKAGGTMAPSTLDLLAWGVFRSVLLQVYDHLDAIEKAEDAAAQAKAEPPAPRWPGDRALQPSKPGLSPSGYSPR